jgi:BirA family biotin operon repressor/biotin-[acetyl-CoA-carboxylase] ligase
MIEHELKQDFFKTKHLGKCFYHFPTITSTQTFLKKLLTEDKIPVGTVILADQQSMGRGTQGRRWVKLTKPQLTFSILLEPALPAQKFPIINLLCGVLLVQTMNEIGIQAQIKWPNDVYINNKKVAGILSELNTAHKQPRVIVGVGINTEATPGDFPPHLQEIATALSMHSSNVNRFDFLEFFLQKLETALYEWLPEQMIKFTQQQFEKLWMYQNQPIEVRQEQKILHGVSRRINSAGALELETKLGTEFIYSGSVVSNSTI